MTPSVCAVIAVRNEASYLRVLLPLLAQQRIEVVILDNDSSDGSREICEEHLGDPVVRVENLPYRGYFSLSEQLENKQRTYSELKHDWLIHQDADEILEHADEGVSLRRAIEDADGAGYTALNFDEFVFLPEPGQDYRYKDYRAGILRYYFFELTKNRLNRAWKRTASLDHRSSGGHTLSGNELRIHPVNQILRHYIVLGYEHAKEKYLGRTFDQQDTARGWHGNRRNITAENLALPVGSRYLFSLSSADSKEFRRDWPSKKHYWEWSPQDLTG